MDALEDWVDVNTCLQDRDIFTCDHVTEGGGVVMVENMHMAYDLDNSIHGLHG